MAKFSLIKNRICFLGAGNMAEALISGLIQSHPALKKNIVATDTRTERVRYLAGKYRIKTNGDNIKSVLSANVIVIAVKPAQIDGLLSQISGKVKKEQLVVSIAAGVTTKHIERYLPGIPVIRIMPNTAALAREGMIVICRGKYAKLEDERVVKKLFESVGSVMSQPERMFNAVTAVSGSGPAYVFYLAESMINIAKELGFDESAASTLVVQTLFGAGRMLKVSADTPEVLRQKVTSPGGTTERAIKCFEKYKLYNILSEAIKLANRRAFELSN
jgi:pyrroline-5-carboxylate reductase